MFIIVLSGFYICNFDDNSNGCRPVPEPLRVERFIPKCPSKNCRAKAERNCIVFIANATHNLRDFDCMFIAMNRRKKS